MDDNWQADLEAAPRTTEALLGHVDRAWTQLQQTLAELRADDWTEVRDSNGWTIKDHLAHITAWEQSLLALLKGRDRTAAQGLGDVNTDDLDVDAVNALIRERNGNRTLDEVRSAFQRSHADVRAAISALSDDDLKKPYAHYQPNDPEARQDPVVGWIIGNTVEHYWEHNGWIRQLLADR